jgi:uncharacterized protein YdbL (DUF1318 family)
MKNRFFTPILLAAMLFAVPAFALDLHAARAQGLVGETLTGYIAVVKDTPDARAVVAEVNAARRAEYARIAAENGQTADVVGTLASEQIINNLEPGEYYKGSDGTWKRR